MNFTDWYTDRMDVYRTVDTLEDNLTHKSRELVLEGVPCRVYKSALGGITMREAAATVEGVNKLACGVGTDIHKGDELLVTRGGGLNAGREPERFFAGAIQPYYEPFGGVLPGLDHLELAISEQEMI